jgi:hypothetical protein
VGRSDFFLVPPGSNQSEGWYIDRFLPLTCRNVSEWIAVANVPGIPIALDASKGTYYILFEFLQRSLRAPVLLRLPGRERKDLKVGWRLALRNLCSLSQRPPRPRKGRATV